MSTRNLTMVINRKYASESELGFAQNPVYLSDKYNIRLLTTVSCNGGSIPPTSTKYLAFVGLITNGGNERLVGAR